MKPFKVQFEDSRGVYLTAAQNLYQGTELFSCSGIGSVFEGHRKRLCAFCFKSTVCPFKCFKCDQIYACSEDCMTHLNAPLVNGMNRHELICSSFRRACILKSDANELSIVKLVLVLLGASISQCIDDETFKTLIGSSRKENVEALLETHENGYTLPCLNRVWDLVSHETSWQDDRKRSWKKALKVLQTQIHHVLETCKSQGVDLESDPRFVFHGWSLSSIQSNDFIDLVLIPLISRIESNGFGVWKGGPKDICTGRCILLQASFFNHSCDPNVGNTTLGNKRTFHTLRDVPEGEVLTISYIDTHLPVSARRNLLMTEYQFHCDCTRCTIESDGKSVKLDYNQGKKYVHVKPKKKKKSLNEALSDLEIVEE